VAWDLARGAVVWSEKNEEMGNGCEICEIRMNMNVVWIQAGLHHVVVGARLITVQSPG
jgi:hypothetical protein